MIVGAGFGGIAAAIELRRHGFDQVTLLERAPGLGGTWRDNDYPGCACDVPSQLYSFSFATRRDWPRLWRERSLLAWSDDDLGAWEAGIDRAGADQTFRYQLDYLVVAGSTE